MDEDPGKGHICWGIWQRWWHLSKQSVGWGFIRHLLSSWRWSPSFSPASPESELSIFEYLYIEETVTQNVELLSIFGSLAIFTDLYLDLKAKLIGDRLLSSLAQTLFWEEIHHPGCIRQGAECFHSRNENDHPCSSIPCWPALTLFSFIHFHLFIHKPNEFSFLRVSLQNEAPRTYFCLTHFVCSFQVVFWFCLAVSLHWSVSSAPNLIILKGSQFIVAASAPSVRFAWSCLLLESHSRNLWRWRGNEALPTEPEADSILILTLEFGNISWVWVLCCSPWHRVCVGPDVSSKAMPSENSTSMSLINPSWRQFLKRLHNLRNSGYLIASI